MMGPTHRLFAALAGASYASLTGETVTLCVFAAVVATPTSNGPLSPDTDQTPAWVNVRQAGSALPLIGTPIRKLMGHRGITHWWVLPVLAWWLGLPALPDEVRWTATYLLIGWISHLVGDLIFGELRVGPAVAGPELGFGLKTDGLIEAGKTRKGTRVIPFGIHPIHVAIIAATAAVLWYTPTMTDLTPLSPLATTGAH